jgi:hypothetical protein
MARKTWREWSEEVGPVTVQEIVDGLHDKNLDILVQAAKARLKFKFRKGQRVRLTGTKSIDLEGKEAVITKVNQKTISVGIGEKDEWGLYSGGEYNVSPGLLEEIVA